MQPLISGSSRHWEVRNIRITKEWAVACGDSFGIGRRLSIQTVRACERMRAFIKELKNNHTKSEQVMDGFAIDFGEPHALQFGRSKLRATDPAPIEDTLRRVPYLEGIGIHHGNEGGFRCEN